MVKFVSPLIVVEDIALSRRFYESALGQEVEFDFGENVAFKGGFSIHLKTHFQTLLGGAERFPVVAKANNAELYFETEALEATHQQLVAAGASFIHDVIEQPWGQRAMRLYDPDGHILEIGESMQAVVRRFHALGWADERIMEKTGMPQDFITEALQQAE